MRRAFGYDLLACERCGGKMVLLSCILRRDVIVRILARAGPVDCSVAFGSRCARGCETGWMGRCAVEWTGRRLLRLMRSAARGIVSLVQGLVTVAG